MTGQVSRTLKEYLPFVYLFIADGINGNLREEEGLWNSIIPEHSARRPTIGIRLLEEIIVSILGTAAPV